MWRLATGSSLVNGLIKGGNSPLVTPVDCTKLHEAIDTSYDRQTRLCRHPTIEEKRSLFPLHPIRSY